MWEEALGGAGTVAADRTGHTEMDRPADQLALRLQVWGPEWRQMSEQQQRLRQREVTPEEGRMRAWGGG